MTKLKGTSLLNININLVDSKGPVFADWVENEHHFFIGENKKPCALQTAYFESRQKENQVKKET